MTFPIDSKIRMKISNSYGGGDLSCNKLFDLLENRISQGANPARNRLLSLLAEARQHTNKAEHTVGSNDKTMHYTIFIDGKGYHLRTDRQGHVFQITNNMSRDLGTIPPWVPPGAAY